MSGESSESGASYNHYRFNIWTVVLTRYCFPHSVSLLFRVSLSCFRRSSYAFPTHLAQPALFLLYDLALIHPLSILEGFSVLQSSVA